MQVATKCNIKIIPGFVFLRTVPKLITLRRPCLVLPTWPKVRCWMHEFSFWAWFGECPSQELTSIRTTPIQLIPSRRYLDREKSMVEINSSKIFENRTVNQYLLVRCNYGVIQWSDYATGVHETHLCTLLDRLQAELLKAQLTGRNLSCLVSWLSGVIWEHPNGVLLRQIVGGTTYVNY